MAFTAVQFPRDNDQSQLSLWPDNGELGRSDNFFDQFLTFDTGDAVFEDPPSPSILLESLESELNNPAQPLGLPRGDFHTATTSAVSQPISITPDPISADQIDPNSALFAGLTGDPVLGNGSISDSELLHLEGISLKSSPHRGNVTAPSSPTLAPSSPRKHNRFVESVYATIRRVAHPRKPAKQEPYQPIDMTSIEAFFDDPKSGIDLFDLNCNQLTDPIVPIKQEPLDGHDLPLSPPLTGCIPNEHQHSLTGFVTGHLDDPFYDDLLNTPATMYSSKPQELNTPLNTPAINTETFLQNQVMTPLNTNMGGNFHHPQKAYRNTSSAEWPMEGLLTDARFNEDVSMWSMASSGAYMADNGNNMESASWWETPQMSETLHSEPTRQTANGGAVHSNGAHNISMHNQQADLPYEYNADLSGLMIQMPQPRVPQASVLSADLNDQFLGNHTISSSANYHLQSTPTMTRTRTDRIPQYNGKSYGHTEKRPRPRAPSSGARHHGAQTSPRKMRHSMSLGHLREESHSPSPMPRQNRHSQHHDGSHGHSSHQERQQQRRSSLTLRKQRSFSRRSGSEPQTPGKSVSATFATTPTSGGGGGGGLDFVNFTPNDKNVLMTGVAPSGSSKTKARREKEAMDREKEAQEKARQIRDMALKVVQEVGGDITRLSGDFALR
ncbi:hypothetical protein GQX73_g3996 [Xylaria multiplex]|uniref:Developmental regulatory protein wetA n=1 Tax=Xylaria multiplex TaxID=323545 RepID=A0A7C8IUN8_9PEZI|nr:hypothetical protein GQX73_g3996 [Xylaria multiplex]